MILTLGNNYTLSIESYLKNAARVVILQNGEEVACRKETLKRLTQFIHSTEDVLFKGRLQLYKSATNITIKLKGNEVGMLAIKLFEQLLKNVTLNN